jgi:hypothetical protein
VRQPPERSVNSRSSVRFFSQFLCLLVFDLEPCTADLVIAIESAMPILLTSLKQGNSDVRVAIISVIHALYKQCIISL